MVAHGRERREMWEENKVQWKKKEADLHEWLKTKLRIVYCLAEKQTVE